MVANICKRIQSKATIKLSGGFILDTCCQGLSRVVRGCHVLSGVVTCCQGLLSRVVRGCCHVLSGVVITWSVKFEFEAASMS